MRRLQEWMNRSVFCAFGLHSPCDGTAYSIRCGESDRACPCSCHWDHL